MKLVYPNVTGALCAKMDRVLSGQHAVNGMALVFRIIQGGYRGYIGRELLQRPWRKEWEGA